MSSTILTNKAQYFFFDNPEAHNFDIEEIAHALSHVCRYTGHVNSFYSVAQHSVHTSYLVPPELAMTALMHDASEAYLGDVSSPLKRLLPEYKVIEKRVEAAIAKQYGLPHPMPPEVKTADMLMLVTEKRDLMVRGRPDDDAKHWPDIQPLDMVIMPWSSIYARTVFLERFQVLKALAPLL